MSRARRIIESEADPADFLKQRWKATSSTDLNAFMDRWEAAGVTNFVSEKDGLIKLSQVVVPKDKRNEGIGTRYMDELCAYADRTGQTIALTPDGVYGGSKRRLGEFYRRFGFRTHRNYAIRDTLIREPRGKVAESQATLVYRGDFPHLTSFGGRDQANRIQGNIFWTTNPNVAKRYARIENSQEMRRIANADPETLGPGHGFYRAHLTLNNPLVLDGQGEPWSDVPVPEPLATQIGAFRGVAQIDELAVEARKLGYDGLIVRDVMDQWGDGDQYVAFRPEQIRLV